MLFMDEISSTCERSEKQSFLIDVNIHNECQ